LAGVFVALLLAAIRTAGKLRLPFELLLRGVLQCKLDLLQPLRIFDEHLSLWRDLLARRAAAEHWDLFVLQRVMPRDRPLLLLLVDVHITCSRIAAIDKGSHIHALRDLATTTATTTTTTTTATTAAAGIAATIPPALAPVAPAYIIQGVLDCACACVCACAAAATVFCHARAPAVVDLLPVEVDVQPQGIGLPRAMRLPGQWGLCRRRCSCCKSLRSLRSLGSRRCP
jgi:hypothetical protein